jgi:hypothetical protein
LARQLLHKPNKCRLIVAHPQRASVVHKEFFELKKEWNIDAIKSKEKDRDD